MIFSFLACRALLGNTNEEATEWANTSFHHYLFLRAHFLNFPLFCLWPLRLFLRANNLRATCMGLVCRGARRALWQHTLYCFSTGGSAKPCVFMQQVFSSLGNPNLLLICEPSFRILYYSPSTFRLCF
jgi:hypothetical protein